MFHGETEISKLRTVIASTTTQCEANQEQVHCMSLTQVLRRLRAGCRRRLQSLITRMRIGGPLPSQLTHGGGERRRLSVGCLRPWPRASHKADVVSS